MLTDEQIVATLSEYGVFSSHAQCEQIRAYISILSKWNRAISLTTVTNEIDILKFHFGESAFALSAVSGLNGRLADVGAGAGFPGIPLCIFDEGIDLSLIESNGKKCAFLSEVVRELGLRAVKVIRARFQDLAGDTVEGCDVIAARALGGYDDLLEWSAKLLRPGGKVVLWLGDDESKSTSSRSGWKWSQPILIPGSQRRYVLSGSVKDAANS